MTNSFANKNLNVRVKTLHYVLLFILFLSVIWVYSANSPYAASRFEKQQIVLEINDHIFSLPKNYISLHGSTKRQSFNLEVTLPNFDPLTKANYKTAQANKSILSAKVLSEDLGSTSPNQTFFLPNKKQFFEVLKLYCLGQFSKEKSFDHVMEIYSCPHKHVKVYTNQKKEFAFFCDEIANSIWPNPICTNSLYSNIIFGNIPFVVTFSSRFADKSLHINKFLFEFLSNAKQME